MLSKFSKTCQDEPAFTDAIYIYKDTTYVFTVRDYPDICQHLQNPERENNMKVVILAGGFGSRISEGSDLKPKPMVEIGGKPILWHIMKYYSSYGFNEFIICLGYMQYVVKEYFADYYLHNSDVEFDLKENTMKVLDNRVEPWKVTLVDTGYNTMTGGRIKRIQKYIGDEPFLLTYGDGLCDMDLNKLIEFHKSHGKIGTITAINFGQSKGTLDISGDGQVLAFREKEEQDGEIINGGYMIFNPQVFDYLGGDDCVFEKGPISSMARDGQLMSYRHKGFWQCMDTQREHKLLEQIWNKGNAPWKRW